MASGAREIEFLGGIQFRGKIGQAVRAYAKRLQRFANDLGGQLDTDAAVAERQMRKLAKKHPTLNPLQVRLRAHRVARRLRRARDLSVAMGAEAVKFHAEYVKQFADVERKSAKRRRSSGEVDL
jgi:hypothetical protein